MKPLDADYCQTMLLPPSVEDWIGPEHPARYIREFVDSLRERDLGISDPVDPLGRPPYSVWLLLKIWLLGYALRIRSSRELEEAVRSRVDLMWIAGLHRPDHNTLWRFWREHEDLIRRLFRETVRIAFEFGMVDFALHAIDGTKIQANGSTYRAVRHKDLERYLLKLDEAIASLEDQIRQAGTEGGASLGEITSQLQERKTLREKIESALENTPDDQIARHPGEPEARMMKGVGIGYNAQTVVDAQGEIIVETALVNDQNDTQQLVPMLDRVYEEYGRVADETVADGGYNTAEALAASEDKEYPVILGESSAEAPKNQGPYSKQQFQYDAEQDVVICPEGIELTFLCIINNSKRREPLRRYRTNACKTCPVRDRCTKDPKGRSIDLDLRHLAAIERHRQKRNRSEKTALLKRRLPVAERPFAAIKHHARMTRFTATTKLGAEIQWLFTCAVYNLGRIFRQVSLLTCGTTPQMSG